MASVAISASRRNRISAQEQIPHIEFLRTMKLFATMHNFGYVPSVAVIHEECDSRRATTNQTVGDVAHVSYYEEYRRWHLKSITCAISPPR